MAKPMLSFDVMKPSAAASHRHNPPQPSTDRAASPANENADVALLPTPSLLRISTSYAMRAAIRDIAANEARIAEHTDEQAGKHYMTKSLDLFSRAHPLRRACMAISESQWFRVGLVRSCMMVPCL